MNERRPPGLRPPSPVDQALANADQLRRAGRFADAEFVCRQTLTHAPGDPRVLNFLALLLSRRGELAEAEALLRRAIALAPRDAVLHNNLGNVFHKKEDHTQALACYERAVSLKDDYPEAHHNLGILRRLEDDFTGALSAQDRALQLRPGYAEAHTERGIVLSALGRNSEALAALDVALGTAPNHFDAHYYRGVLLTTMFRHGDAAASLGQAVALRPQSYEAQYALGNVFNYLNREIEALEAYKKAIELKPDYAFAHYDFSSLAWTMGRREISLSSYAFARGKVGDKPDLMLAEADVRIRLNQPQEATELLRRALDITPERADVANGLGRALATEGRHAESIPIFLQAIARDPENPRHRTEMASAQLSLGRGAEAVTTLEESLRIAPMDQLGLSLLSLAYRDNNDERFRTLFDERFIGVYDLPVPAGFRDIHAFNDALANELVLLHTRKIEPFDQTLRGGTQTMGRLFTRDSRTIATLQDALRDAIADYIRKLPDDPRHPFLSRKDEAFSFAGSWSCKLRSSGFHTNHIHPRGWISSAYYAALPDVVRDEKGQQGWIKFGESSLNLNERDRAERAVQPVVGRLVLFPSYFWHGTIPFEASDPRLTVAFDVVPGQSEPLRPSGTERNY